MNLGDLTLKLAFVLAVVALVAAVRWAGGRKASERTFRLAYHGMTSMLLAGSVILLAAILRHDFRYEYVINYTSRDLPLLYLFSAFWAGQAGTFLLWALLAALIGYALFHKRSWEPAAVMTSYLPTVGFLLALMLVPAGNPFRLATAVPPDGHGLNPLLQDPWMASHPPLVFLGYAAMTVPAVLALVALVRRREDGWLGPALRWGLTAFIALGSGIVLGGFWAYKVLGWGGYWGWDPVENASLVPWLVVTALIHGILVQKATGSLPRTNLVLALSCYVLVLYATFLTRSGVLADFSVHSFPQGSIYKVLVTILIVVLGVSIFALLRRRAPEGRSVETRLAWPFVISTVIVLLVVSAGFVLIGMSWPILSSLAGKPAAVGTSFYNWVNLPVYVAMFGLLTLGPFLAWVRRPARDLIVRLLPSVVVAVVGTAIALSLGAKDPGRLSLLFVVILALTSNVVRFVEVARYRLLGTGAALAHIGFALMFVGIVASSWGVSERAELPLGAPVDALDRIVTFRGHVQGSEPQDRWRVVVMRPGQAEITTEVAMFRTSPDKNDAMMQRPAILRSWTGDLYIAPVGLRTDEGPRRNLDLRKDQPVGFHDATLTFERFETEGMASADGMLVRAWVLVQRGDEEERLALPLEAVGGQMRGRPVSSALVPEMRFALERMAVEQGRILVAAEHRGAQTSQALVVELSTKPLMGLLWVGTLLLGLGCVVATARRVVEARALGVGGEATVVVKKKDPRRARERKRHAARVARA